MNKLEESLHKMAESILYLDEASVMSLWETYKTKMEDFSFSPEWEKSVVIFSIINSVRVKNTIFNEQMLKNNGKDKPAPPRKKPGKPHLRLVK